MAQPSKPTTKTPPAISAITVEGFKSIVEAQTLEIRPLTILAGANSSGKSSMMQPLLLLKQTLEAQFDPGPLLLNGPNVKFTSASQLISSVETKNSPREFLVRLDISDETYIQVNFAVDPLSGKIALHSNEYKQGANIAVLSSNTSSDDIKFIMGNDSKLSTYYDLMVSLTRPDNASPSLAVSRERCFYYINWFPQKEDGGGFGEKLPLATPLPAASNALLTSIHVCGLRGNPERSYDISAVGPRYPGTFEHYVASLIVSWSMDEPDKLQSLNGDLSTLGLTWKVEATPLNDTQAELRVGRLKNPKRGGSNDLVSIADVGFGVSQTLPVLVALRAANPGRLVYIEQPEIHLHPRAQVAMAKVLADAALRGVRVVVETHSALLLLAVQTLVAEGSLPADLVKLNWFIRDEETGITRIHAAELDEAGRFGDWPEDFADTALEAESRYLSAAEARLIGNGKDG